MSKSELTDNLTFASALQMLKQLVEQGLLTTATLKYEWTQIPILTPNTLLTTSFSME